MQLSDETKKELDSFLQTSLSAITSTISNGAEFVKGQAPELAREIVLYEGIVENLVGAFTSLLVMGILAFAANLTHNYVSADFAPLAYGAILVGLMIALICLIACLCNAVKARLAPKLFLLRYVSSLVKPTKSE